MRSLSLLGLAAAAAAQLTSTGASVSFNDVYYYISPFSQGKVFNGSFNVASLPKTFGFTPITVVADVVAKESLEGLFSNWTTQDDVWQPAFLSAIFLAGLDAPCLSKASYFANTQSVVVPLAAGSSIPSGPYFLETATGDVYQAFRLYSDFAAAFSESLLQTPEGRFQPLSAQIPSSSSLTIGVPSRLYFTPTAAKPLAGVRVGVKDIYALAGVKRSNGNRAWWNLYPAAETTGTAMQNLIDAGAIFVGLQKPSQFANGESATADWVDYHAPFNPRGDGYNDPSSSSSGAGASIGSYDWLDIAVGSDTGGSIRGPAGSQGIFGNRPSHNLVSLDNVMPLSPTLDTAGFLIRDPYLWDRANKALYKDNYSSLVGKTPKYPKTVYTMGFPTSASAASVIQNKFATDLAAFVGGTVTPFVLQTAWAASAAGIASNVTLSTLLGPTYATLITKEQIELVRDPFFADYAAAYDGRRPFVNPVPLSRWAYGDSIPDSFHDDAIRNKTIFMDWFNSEVLAPVADPLQCSSGFLLYPGASGNPSPRNRYLSAPGVPLGFSSGRISVFTEAPDSVFPLGEVGSLSSITNHIEFLPVTVDIMVAKGCDGLLVKLAQDLVAAGAVLVPKVGRTLNGGEILLKRGAMELEMEIGYPTAGVFDET